MNKKLNKKGFTLVEIIAVIAILALIIILVVPNITKSSEGARQKAYDTKVSQIEEAAEIYAQDNFNNYVQEALRNNQNQLQKEISVQELITQGYIAPDDKATGKLLNPKTNEPLNDRIIRVIIDIKNRKVEVQLVETTTPIDGSSNPSPVELKFKIGENTYSAEENMTWEDWVDSSYNTLGIYVENNRILISSSNLNPTAYRRIDTTIRPLTSENTLHSKIIAYEELQPEIPVYDELQPEVPVYEELQPEIPPIIEDDLQPETPPIIEDDLRPETPVIEENCYLYTISGEIVSATDKIKPNGNYKWQPILPELF